MAHNIQMFREKSLIIHDLDLIVLMAFALKLIRENPQYAVLEECAEQWKCALANYGPGVLDLGLEELENAPTKIDALAALLTGIEVEVIRSGESVPASVLNALTDRVPGVVFSDYKVELILELIRAFRCLLTDS